jgi:hypothetical protein
MSLLLQTITECSTLRCSYHITCITQSGLAIMIAYRPPALVTSILSLIIKLGAVCTTEMEPRVPSLMAKLRVFWLRLRRPY